MAPLLKTATVKQLYERPASFTDLLPWVEYDPDSRTFLLEDGVSLGAVFDIEPVGCEARTPEFMARLRDAIQTAINEAIPELDEAPWILQVYVQDEPSLTDFTQSLAALRATRCPRDRVYPLLPTPSWPPICRRSPAREDCLTIAAVTGSRWQGQIRRVRAVLYRRLKTTAQPPAAIEVEEALKMWPSNGWPLWPRPGSRPPG